MGKNVIRHNETPYTVKMGRELRSFRKASGLTLIQIADSLGVSVAYISRIESGKADPTVHFLIALLRIYGYKPYHFFYLLHEKGIL